jgi:translocation and assembly module TamB
VALGGTVQLAQAPVLDLRLVARNARPVVSDLVTATSDADVSLRGAYGGDLLAAGRIGLRRVEIRIPERMPAQLPVLKVRVRGAKPEPVPVPPPPVALDVLVEAPGNVFVRGRGLEAELAGRVAIRGTLAAPQPEGALTLRRGSFNLLGTALTLTEGQVGMDATAPLDPAIDFAATTRSSGTSATVRVTGRASSPEIRLTSEPELPQDEILAQLLLGRPVSQLNALQLAQIAAGVAELSGKGSGFDPLGRLRGGLGLDRLAVGGTEGGAATLEAGRNLAPGVYLGVRQGTGDAGTKATVQIDLGRGLKLQGEVGSSSGTPSATGRGGNGNSVGVVWSREW